MGNLTTFKPAWTVSVTIVENKLTNAEISESELYIFLWVVTILCLTINIFGIVTNSINIYCFCKQDFKDPVNVSLLGLALSDICCLSTSMWTSICYNPTFMNAEFPFHAIEYQYLTGAIPHTTFTRITAWITAFITLERCLCITVPLKIKQIVTTKRVTLIIVFIFLTLISSVSPLYVVNTLGMKYFPDRNKTLVGLIFTTNRENVEAISFAVNNTCIPFGAFVIIIVCTVTLISHLRISNDWLRTSALSDSAVAISKRNRKITKMVLMISLLFIACFIPLSCLFMAMSMIPDLSIDGKYKNILTLTGSIGFVLESINSSTNIFIYYHTSSKYREALNKIF